MVNTISYFGVGVIDPSQGGSGITNSLIIKFILSKNIRLNIFLTANNSFYDDYKSNSSLIKNFKSKNVNLIFINTYPKSKYSKFLFGKKYFENISDLSSLNKSVLNYYELIDKSDLIITIGHPWACVVNQVFKNKKIYNVIDFPFFEIRKYEVMNEKRILIKAFKFLKYLSYKNLIKKNKLFFRSPNVSTFSYSNDSVQKLKKIGINSSKIKYFVTPQLKIKHNNDRRISFLHIGDLNTTTSRIMIDELDKKYLEILNDNLKIDFDFIGKKTNFKFNSYSNITLNFLGKIDNLRSVLSKKKYIFFFPTNFIPGIRTRLLTPLSYGIPVIFHNSALIGLPEFKNLEFKFESSYELINLLKFISSKNFDYISYSEISYNFWKKNFYYRKNLSDSLFKDV